jgi:DNA-binding PadR family transcriptional regulator
VPELEPLSPGEWSVLALLCERNAHGWPLVRTLGPDGEIGRIWTVRRAVVYRTLDVLLERHLIEPAGVEESARGPRRTVMRPTRSGRAALRRWLAEPVRHVRDLRSLMLLKLVFAQRSGLDQTPMLIGQRAALEEIEASLGERLGDASGSDELLLRFRLETTRAAGRFVDGLLAEPVRPSGGRPPRASPRGS